MEVTTIGPVEKRVRDRVAEYRDREECDNYNEAVKLLLRQVEGK